MFTPQQTAGWVNQNRESYDNLGRRVVVPIRTYMERKGYVLEPKFVFIDGRTGAALGDVFVDCLRAHRDLRVW